MICIPVLSVLAVLLAIPVFRSLLQPEAYEISMGDSSVTVTTGVRDSYVNFSISNAIRIEGRVLDFIKEGKAQFGGFGAKYWFFYVREGVYQTLMKKSGKMTRCGVANLGIPDFHTFLTPASQNDLELIKAADVKRKDAFLIEGLELIFRDGKFEGSELKGNHKSLLIEKMILNGKQIIPELP